MNLKKIILLSAITFSLSINAQAQNEFYNDGANVYVQAAGLIYVQGDVINDDQGGNIGRMYNSGNIQLTGNWSNTSVSNVFQAFDLGMTTFLGTGAVQTIGGTADTYFNNLTLNKSGAAVQEVRLLRNSLSDGVLNLTNDFLNTQTFVHLVANPNPAAITRTGSLVPNVMTNAVNLGYVTSTPGSVGRLARATSNVFPGAVYMFPVGTAARYRPVSVTPTSVGNNIYTAQYVDLPTFSTGLRSATLASINPNWYHFIERQVAAGSPEDVRVYWDDIADGICSTPQITLSEWDNALWFDLSATASVGNAAPILSHTTKNGYPGAFPTPWLLTPIATPWALADLLYGPWGPPCIILPSANSPLTATAQTSDILLTWNTQTEQDNAGFEMQRSTDANNFQTIGYVVSQGDATAQQNYSLVDREVVPNQIYYYRFNQIDRNGTSVSSNVAEAMIATDNAFIVGSFYPSPSNGMTQLWVIASGEDEIAVKIYNAIGQEVFGHDYHLVSGYNELPFNLSQIADGSYYAIISHEGEQFTRKFSIER
jgi:Secretion system C-terminal sorting domain